jgi:hypothetical protein
MTPSIIVSIRRYLSKPVNFRYKFIGKEEINRIKVDQNNINLRVINLIAFFSRTLRVTASFKILGEIPNDATNETPITNIAL